MPSARHQRNRMSLQRPISPVRKAISRVILALILLSFVWGFLIEPSRLVVNATTLPLPAWPRALDGTRHPAGAIRCHAGDCFTDARRRAVRAGDED